MVCIKTLIVGAIAVDSALAFAPSTLNARLSSQTALRNSNDGNNRNGLLARRDVLERTVAAAIAGVLTAPSVAFAEPPAVASAETLAANVAPAVNAVASAKPAAETLAVNVAPAVKDVAPAVKAVASAKPALTADALTISIQSSTSALAESLGHALVVIDSLNSQARRIGSSPDDPDHPVAVLDGMHAQARRLVADLDKSSAVMDTLKAQAFELTAFDEDYRVLVRDASILDGLLAQSKRLVSAMASGGSTDSQLTYMLAVLDGLNAQARRVNMPKMLSELEDMKSEVVVMKSEAVKDVKLEAVKTAKS